MLYYENQGLLKDVEHIRNPPQKINCVLLYFLIIGPIIMGIHLNSLANDKPIKEHFFTAMNNTNQKNFMLKNVNPTDMPKEEIIFPSYLRIFSITYPIGGLLGSVCSNKLLNKYGRKNTAYIFIIITIIGAIIKFAAYYTYFVVLMVGRFFDGISSAGLMIVCTVILKELAPPRHLKIIKLFTQLSINFGVCFISLILTKQVLYTHFQWSYLIVICLCLVLFGVIYLLPESPFYVYLNQNNPSHTLPTFNDLEAVYGHEMANIYYHAIIPPDVDDNQSISSEIFTIRRLFYDKKYRLATITLVVTRIAQQFSGMYCVVAFGQIILAKVGLKRPDLVLFYLTICSLIASTVATSILAFIKRKPTILTCHGIMGVCLIVIAQYFNTNPRIILPMFVILMIAFQFGPGPMPWILSIEMFPAKAASDVQSIFVLVNWVCVIIVFAIPFDRVGIYIMYFFAGSNFLMVLYGSYFLAETFRIPCETILNEYGHVFM